MKINSSDDLRYNVALSYIYYSLACNILCCSHLRQWVKLSEMEHLCKYIDRLFVKVAIDILSKRRCANVILCFNVAVVMYTAIHWEVSSMI